MLVDAEGLNAGRLRVRRVKRDMIAAFAAVLCFVRAPPTGNVGLALAVSRKRFPLMLVE
jgi:hypothetical protein